MWNRKLQTPCFKNVTLHGVHFSALVLADIRVIYWPHFLFTFYLNLVLLHQL